MVKFDNGSDITSLMHVSNHSISCSPVNSFDTTSDTKRNIKLLLPKLWDLVDEDVKWNCF